MEMDKAILQSQDQATTIATLEKLLASVIDLQNQLDNVQLTTLASYAKSRLILTSVDSRMLEAGADIGKIRLFIALLLESAKKELPVEAGK